MTLTLDAAAARVVWWKEPSEALADPRHFLARVMAVGTFDARSWAYWNLVCDRQASELPRRRLPGTS
jgi:hypothetical protein